MALPEPFCHFIDPLETAELPYCVTGSVAAGLYGEERTTKDIDLVLLLNARDIRAFRAAFPERDFYVPPTETLLIETARAQRSCLNLYHHGTGFKADLFFAGHDPLRQWALTNRRRLEYGAGHIWAAPPEYVVIRKLEYFREGRSDKHVRDLRFMLAVTALDAAFLQDHIARLGLSEQWQEVLIAYRGTGGAALPAPPPNPWLDLG